MGMLDNILDSVSGSIAGIILICGALIPISVQMIGGLTGDAAKYAIYVELVVIVAIVGLIIGVIKFYQDAKR